MSGAHLVWNEARELGIEKWEKGEREHGGSLFLKPVLNEAIDEALDQTCYLLVLRRQLSIVKLHLAEALATGNRESIEAALNILNTGNPDGETV